MWIIQEPNNLALWNKLHFEEKKTESVGCVQNIQYLHLLNKYIKMQSLEVSGAVRPIYGSLGVKRLSSVLGCHCWRLHFSCLASAPTLEQTEELAHCHSCWVPLVYCQRAGNIAQSILPLLSTTNTQGVKSIPVNTMPSLFYIPGSRACLGSIQLVNGPDFRLPPRSRWDLLCSRISSGGNSLPTFRDNLSVPSLSKWS